MFPVPTAADGSKSDLPPGKNKTWGPSTLHQRERGQILRSDTDGGGGGEAEKSKRWSRSAPNLEKPMPRASRHRDVLHEIGRGMGMETFDEQDEHTSPDAIP